MTAFYCFPAGFDWQSSAPKEHVIVPPKQIGEEPLLDEEGEPVLNEEGEEVMQPIFEDTVHVNTLAAVEDWEEYQCFPESPRMMYA